MIDKERAFVVFEKYLGDKQSLNFKFLMDQMKNSPEKLGRHLENAMLAGDPDLYPTKFKTEGEFPLDSKYKRKSYLYLDVFKLKFPNDYQKILHELHQPNLQDNKRREICKYAILQGRKIREEELVSIFMEYLKFKEQQELLLRKLVRRVRGEQRVKIGLGLLLLGGLITATTYAFADIGGSYIICWGAMAVGAFYFLIGLFEWLGS